MLDKPHERGHIWGGDTLMLKILTVIFLLFSCDAWSAPPPEHKSAKVQDPKATSSPKDDDPSKTVAPINITVTQGNQTNGEACCKEKHEDGANPEWFTAIGTIVLAVITVFLAAFTYFLWRSTSELVKNTKDSDRILERAYIKMSHMGEGLKPGSTIGHYSADIRVENHGNTPGEVTDLHCYIYIGNKDERLPENPDAERGNQRPLRVFLAAREHFDFRPQDFTVNVSELEECHIGKKILYLIAHVDYRDRFGIRHRAGYARQQDYNASKGINNWVFVTQAGYNYDRIRKKGEGDDWDDKPPS